MLDFVHTLVDLTYCSTEYAMGKWGELSDEDKENPEQAARDFVKKHKLSRKSYDLGEVD
jgi:hypothetical protein